MDEGWKATKDMTGDAYRASKDKMEEGWEATKDSTN